MDNRRHRVDNGKKSQLPAPGACAARHSRSRNTSTSDTDTSPGETPGNAEGSRETGTGRGWLAPAVGPPEPVLLGEPASLDRQVEQGPLHLIHGGGLVLLCPAGTRSPANDTPANSGQTRTCRRRQGRDLTLRTGGRQLASTSRAEPKPVTPLVTTTPGCTRPRATTSRLPYQSDLRDPTLHDPPRRNCCAWQKVAASKALLRGPDQTGDQQATKTPSAEKGHVTCCRRTAGTS